MRSGRFPWGAVAWAAGLTAVPTLIWCAGFLYWRVKMARALAEVRAEVRIGPPPVSMPSRFTGAESRAIPLLIREFREAMTRRDHPLAVALSWELRDTWEAADQREDGSILRSYQGPRIPPDMPLEVMEEVISDDELIWSQRHDQYPQWWMWWSGRRRYP